MLWRSTNRTLAFLGRLLHLPAEQLSQDAFNRFLAAQFPGKVLNEIRKFTADRVRYSSCIDFGGNLHLHPLSPVLFANEDHLSLHLPQHFAMQPYIIFPRLERSTDDLENVWRASLSADLKENWGWQNLFAQQNCCLFNE